MKVISRVITKEEVRNKKVKRITSKEINRYSIKNK